MHLLLKKNPGSAPVPNDALVWIHHDLWVHWIVDSGEANLRQGSFGNTWDGKSFLLSERLLQSAAMQQLCLFVVIEGCASATVYNFNCDVALRPRFCTRGVLPYISHIGMSSPEGWVFAPFWSENGYSFCSLWSGIGYGFQGISGVYERICFNSKWIRKKEKYANSKWILRNRFCCYSHLSKMT